MATLSKKGQETRQKLLETAFELFHEKGIDATSVDDILAHSGAGKSQFYHYFDGKQGIVHELLVHANEVIKSGQTHFKPIDSWEDFREWLDNSMKEMDAKGCTRSCPIGQIASQISEDDELLRQDLQLIFKTMKDYPKEFFIKLKARGEYPESIDADALADLSMSALQGGTLQTKIHRNLSAMQNTADYLYDYLKSLTVKK